MGSCISSANKRTADSAAMKTAEELKFGSKNNPKLVIPPSPIKQTPSPVNASFRDLGSKEEAFFDSQAWLDSDCEDDFYSVNGDFTPSRGSTPVHHNFGTPRVNKISLPAKTPGSIPQPSPSGKKLKLAELFHQRTAEDQRVDGEHSEDGQNMGNEKTEVRTTILDVLPSANGTPYISGANSGSSSERTPNGGSTMEERPMKTPQRCLPSFTSCRAFTTDRRKKMGPATAVNG